MSDISNNTAHLLHHCNTSGIVYFIYISGFNLHKRYMTLVLLFLPFCDEKTEVKRDLLKVPDFNKS